jgi:hypothetical protein
MVANRYRLNPRSISRLQGLRWLLAFFLLSAVWAATAGTPILAQEDLAWSTPENLSRSGAASSPVIVTVPNGRLRVIWWDQFDGLMVADGTLRLEESDTWSTPKAATLLVIQPGNLPGETVTRPIDRAPWIVGDSDGQAHAFWLGSADRDTGERALLYSRLSPGSTNWTSPRAIAGSASTFHSAVDESGTLHLAYVQPGQTGGLSSGLYYTRSRDGGTSWSTAKLVSDSLYLRLLSDEENSLRLTADSQDTVVVTWADPRSGQVMLTHTSNAGTTWDDPRPYATSDGNPLQSRVIAVPDGPEPVVWRPGDQQAGMVAVSSERNALTLAYWQDDAWAATNQLTLRLQDPDLGSALDLTDIHLALVPPPSSQGAAPETLALVGQDQRGDIWIAGTAAESLAVHAAPPSEAPEAVPANLSQGGASSSPAVVDGTNDTLQVLWWDEYQGLMAADGLMSTSTVLSGTEEIAITQEVWSPSRSVPLPVQTTPRILADVTGTLHAFWLGEADTDATGAGVSGAQPVMYSRLEANGLAWSPPIILAEAATGFDVEVDGAGTLHLAYLQALQMPHASAGVYYRQSAPDGTTWKGPVAVQVSRYLRSSSPETTHLDLAVTADSEIYLTWDDIRQERAQLSFSADGGQVWDPPAPIGDPLRRAVRGRLMTVLGGETVVLWEEGQVGSTCTLYQARAQAILDGSDMSGERVLDGLITCPGNEQFVPLDEGQSLMVAGAGGEVLTLAMWDGQRWSELKRLSFEFENPNAEGNVYLVDLGFDLVAVPAGLDSDYGSKALIVVGVDENDDVWTTSSMMGDLEVIFAADPAWSEPITLSASEELPSLPAVATDSTGQVHVLWTEGITPEEPGTELLYARGGSSVEPGTGAERWISPSPVLRSPVGGAENPAMIATDDRLHVVWSGGEGGEIFYSWAFGRDAYTSGGWSAPMQLPGPVPMGSNPVIAQGAGGSLQVLYAIPVNEQRGIYHTRSDDGGETWSPAHQVFDAAGAGWVMADQPRLAVDGQGILHAVWVRFALPGGRSPEGIYHAQSLDGGETWSQAIEIRGGPCDWPQVAVDENGRLHVVWTEAPYPGAWWHQWSEDGGQSWTLAEPIPGFVRVAPPTRLVAGGGEAIYLTGLGTDDAELPALLFATWDGQRWRADQLFRLDLSDTDSGVSAAVETSLQRLDVIFRGHAETGEAAGAVQLWHSWRQIPLAGATSPATSENTAEPQSPGSEPEPLSTSATIPGPAVAQTRGVAPSSTPGPSATPRFGATSAVPRSNSASLPIPLLVAGGLAAVIVAGGFAMGLLRSRHR